jgi:hypothetical protein
MEEMGDSSFPIVVVNIDQSPVCVEKSCLSNVTKVTTNNYSYWYYQIRAPKYGHFTFSIEARDEDEKVESKTATVFVAWMNTNVFVDQVRDPLSDTISLKTLYPLGSSLPWGVLIKSPTKDLIEIINEDLKATVLLEIDFSTLSGNHHIKKDLTVDVCSGNIIERVEIFDIILAETEALLLTNVGILLLSESMNLIASNCVKSMSAKSKSIVFKGDQSEADKIWIYKSEIKLLKVCWL